jgi:hypothetical protein
LALEGAFFFVAVASAIGCLFYRRTL